MKNKLFSKTNDLTHTKINILGLKIKIKHSKYVEKELKNAKKDIKRLQKEIAVLRILMQKSIDITQIPKANGNLRIVQLIKVKVLELITLILEKYNICHWIEYGTLIGAVRHKGFIPWDDDIDIIVLKDDYVKLEEIFKQELAENNFTFSLGKKSQIIRVGYKDYLVDIFPWEYINEKCETENDKEVFISKWLNIKNKFLQKYPIENFINGKLNHIELMNDTQEFKNEEFNCNYQNNKETKQLIRCVESMTATNKCAVFDEEHIFPLRKIEFEGCEFWAPNDPIEHLGQAIEYGRKGNIMNFPRVEDFGFLHALNEYNETEENYLNILNEITNILNNYKQVVIKEHI